MEQTWTWRAAVGPAAPREWVLSFQFVCRAARWGSLETSLAQPLMLFSASIVCKNKTQSLEGAEKTNSGYLSRARQSPAIPTRVRVPPFLLGSPTVWDPLAPPGPIPHPRGSHAAGGGWMGTAAPGKPNQTTASNRLCLRTSPYHICCCELGPEYSSPKCIIYSYSRQFII